VVESYSSKQIKYKTSLTNKGKHIRKWTVFYPVLAQKYARFLSFLMFSFSIYLLLEALYEDVNNSIGRTLLSTYNDGEMVMVFS
jgi:hypothetical protein